MISTSDHAVTAARKAPWAALSLSADGSAHSASMSPSSFDEAE
jgi:hypothetical protein